ncbi:hypothetical protein D3C71_2207850 [compost metagenome]
MADGELVQACLQPQLPHQPPVTPIHEDHRRVHGFDIALGPAEIGMRLDPAIGDNESHAIRH